MHEIMEHLENQQPELLQEIDQKIKGMEERIKRTVEQAGGGGGGGAAEEAAVPSAEEVKRIVTGAVAFGTTEIAERLNQLEVGPSSIRLIANRRCLCPLFYSSVRVWRTLPCFLFVYH